MFCAKCGTEVASDVRFCPSCGSAVGGSPAAEHAPAAEPAPAPAAEPAGPQIPAAPFGEVFRKLRDLPAYLSLDGRARRGELGVGLFHARVLRPGPLRLTRAESHSPRQNTGTDPASGPRRKRNCEIPFTPAGRGRVRHLVIRWLFSGPYPRASRTRRRGIVKAPYFRLTCIRAIC